LNYQKYRFQLAKTSKITLDWSCSSNYCKRLFL